jgi:hypothetical protein
MKKIVKTLGLIALVQASAQTTSDGIKPADVDFTATLRAREYVWDWFQAASPYKNEYAYSGDLLRLNFAEKRGALDLDAEIAIHVRRCDANAGRISDRRLGLEPRRLRLHGVYKGMGAWPSRRRYAHLRNRLRRFPPYCEDRQPPGSRQE